MFNRLWNVIRLSLGGLYFLIILRVYVLHGAVKVACDILLRSL